MGIVGKMKAKQNKEYYDTEYDYLTSYFLSKYVSINELAWHPLKLVEDRIPNCAEGECFGRSNERLLKYMPKLNLSGKRVATVGSSGDQVLNALFYGAKDITLIDGNPYTRAFVEYKIALMKNLSFQEIKRLFNYGFVDKELFSYKTYMKISHDLSKPVQQFWDSLMLEQGDLLNSRYFRRRLLHPGVASYDDSVFYKSEAAYKKLQKILIYNGLYNII